MAHKRATTAAATVGGDSLLERLPENLLHEIFFRLKPPETLTLCYLACVSRTLHSSVNKILFSSFPSIDLSTCSLDSKTFDEITRRFGKVKKITLDCLRLNASSIERLLGPDVEELVLLKCSSLSCKLLASIGSSCPNLRVLTLEFPGFSYASKELDWYLGNILRGCQFLEDLQVKRCGREVDESGQMLSAIGKQLPQFFKVLKLDPVSTTDLDAFLSMFTDTGMEIPVTRSTYGQTLTHLSLALESISNFFIHTIAQCAPFLAELDLNDQPTFKPADDLSDIGVQSLVGCTHLTSLSLIRGGEYTSFKSVTDTGMFRLSEGCTGLESVRLGGFSKVSDAGFTSIFISCLNLKKFEIINAIFLTNLTFRDASSFSRSLVEVKLVSCNSITNEAVLELATCSSLEVLDFHGCRSLSDFCLSNVSRLTLLTHLNLSETDVTDYGMALLGKGNAPISYLSLRGCLRVTDKGITFLFRRQGRFSKTMSSLDLSHIPRITDDTITTVVDACDGLTELCVRNCLNVTDAAVKALALKGSREGENKLLRRLDLYKCTALSAEALEYLKKPLFRGLRWIGMGGTRLFCRDVELAQVYEERPWLVVCVDGCEAGCLDGWHFHKIKS